MRDEERIQMYYKFGLLDWRSEQQFQEKSSSNFNLSLADFTKFFSELIKVVRVKN